MVRCVGRLWFELLTGEKLPLMRDLTQEKIYKLIDDSLIKDEAIVSILKMILLLKP